MPFFLWDLLLRTARAVEKKLLWRRQGTPPGFMVLFLSSPWAECLIRDPETLVIHGSRFRVLGFRVLGF